MYNTDVMLMCRNVNNDLQDEDWQHHPVQRQEEALEEDQAEAVDPWLVLMNGFANRQIVSSASPTWLALLID